MREISFRAWDKITKQYYIVCSLEYGEKGELCEIYLAGVQIDESNPNANLRKPSDVILEQDTGLKDKDGKKIYEGDIVKLCGKVAENKCTLYEVFWEDSIAGLCLVALEKDKSDIGFLTDVETENRYRVIGNIHENLNLLEDK